MRGGKPSRSKEAQTLYGQVEAATRIQAVCRGRAARSEVNQLRPRALRKAPIRGPSLWAADERAAPPPWPPAPDRGRPPTPAIEEVDEEPAPPVDPRGPPPVRDVAVQCGQAPCRDEVVLASRWRLAPLPLCRLVRAGQAGQEEDWNRDQDTSEAPLAAPPRPIPPPGSKARPRPTRLSARPPPSPQSKVRAHLGSRSGAQPPSTLRLRRAFDPLWPRQSAKPGGASGDARDILVDALPADVPESPLPLATAEGSGSGGEVDPSAAAAPQAPRTAPTSAVAVPPAPRRGTHGRPYAGHCLKASPRLDVAQRRPWQDVGPGSKQTATVLPWLAAATSRRNSQALPLVPGGVLKEYPRPHGQWPPTDSLSGHA